MPGYLEELHSHHGTKAHTTDIVNSHPVFSTQYRLSVPITDIRMNGLKKLFALADITHSQHMGPAQFRGLLE